MASRDHAHAASAGLEFEEDLDFCPLCGAQLQLILQQTENGEGPAGQCFDCNAIVEVML